MAQQRFALPTGFDAACRVPDARLWSQNGDRDQLRAGQTRGIFTVPGKSS
jgi:hypothetical protein